MTKTDKKAKLLVPTFLNILIYNYYGLWSMIGINNNNNSKYHRHPCH